MKIKQGEAKTPLKFRRVLLGVLPASLAACLLISFFTVVPAVKRGKAIREASALLQNDQPEQAERVLSPYLSHPDAKAAMEEVVYFRAIFAAKSDIMSAKTYMDQIPGHPDPHRLRRKIKYAEALVAADSGDYETAYTKMDELGNFEDAASQKELLRCEALVLRSLLAQKISLYDPDSLQVKKVTLYQNNGDLDMLAEITATDTLGDPAVGYLYDVTILDGEDHGGVLRISDYDHPQGMAQTLEKLIVDAICQREALDVKVDHQRINRLLEEKVQVKLSLPFSDTGTEVENTSIQ